MPTPIYTDADLVYLTSPNNTLRTANGNRRYQVIVAAGDTTETVIVQARTQHDADRIAREYVVRILGRDVVSVSTIAAERL